MGQGKTNKYCAYQRLVVKLGTNVLTDGKGWARSRMEQLAQQLAQLHQAGYQIIVVSSGAVALGKQGLKLNRKSKGVPFKQVLASVGQIRLMQIYQELFKPYGIRVAQALLGRADILSRLGYLNARNTLLALLALRVMPIVNENDVVAVEELEGATFGDNDMLSAMVANLVDADLLLLLSDVSGLYVTDPTQNTGKRLIPRVELIDAELENLAGRSSGEGTGGMVTKLKAAKLATASGIPVVLADGEQQDVVLRAVAGETSGTFFSPAISKLESRKRWMLSLPVEGKLYVDLGAKEALKKGKKSLLPAGVVEAKGEFGRGEVVAVCELEGSELARGIANYSSEDLQVIKGHHSEEIQMLLGKSFGEEVIHRDNLVVL